MRTRDRDGQFIRRPSRRVGEWFVSTVAVVAIAMPSGGRTDAAEAPQRPNIILIYADDLGWGDLSCQPQDPACPDSAVRTPHIDSLAAEGVRCTEAYATCCVCTPSRVGLLTGRYQQRIGWYEFVEAQVGIPPGETILPEFLRGQGYATALIGKWHVGFPQGARPLDRGFDRFFGILGGQHDFFDPRLGDPTTGMSFDYDAHVRDQDEPVKAMAYLTDELTNHSLAFIDAQAAAHRPFFLYLAYTAPHPPLQATWGKLEPYAKARGGAFNSRDIVRAMIDSMDDGVGRIMHRLMLLGIERDTLVIFTSDNGGHEDRDGQPTQQHNGGLRPRKGFFWEGGIRVPFIVRWPGRLPERAVYTQPVSQLDVFATIAAACNAPADKPLDGVDLVPHLTGANPEPPHDVLYWGFPRASNRWAIRKGRWKLAHEIVDYKAVQPDGVRMETALYDLEADPGETHNLVTKEAGVTAELGGLKDAWYAKLPPSIATAEVRQAWQGELARRKEKLPNPDRLRRDGAPGHWLGAEAAVTSPRIESFPRGGLGYQLIDWKQRTEEFLDVVLDPTLTGDYLPLMWWDDTRVHWPHTTFGLPTYVGMKHQWGTFKNAHEALTTMGTVLSGALVGRDMTRYPVPGSPTPVNLVAMQEAYFSPDDGVFLNAIGGKSGGSFWYELLPSILVGGLVAEHPREEPLTDAWHRSCRRWAEAGLHLWQLNDYDFQAYDLRSREAVVRGWREPDCAAGLAFLMQMAFAKWPEEQAFYHESRHALDWLDRQERNASYEVFMPFGVYAAARCNAEHRTTYDVGKFLAWCFEDSAVRGMNPHVQDVSRGDGWGVLSGRWGDHDVAGLVGVSRGALSTPQVRGGYGFAMGTFTYGWPLVASVRYDNRLARPVGKWMHAAAHTLRLLYPDQLPPDRQTDWDWATKHTTAIPYEGLQERKNLTDEPGPFASGDPKTHDWGPSNLGIYSGALSGVFGGIVQATNVPGVLALDVRRMDFYATGFPTTLLYNPGTEPAHVTLPAGTEPVRAWDAVNNVWLGGANSDGILTVTVPPDAAVVVVCVPQTIEPRIDHGRLVAGSTVIDWSVPADAD
jgi:arylsulfatase A-like enzyme